MIHHGMLGFSQFYPKHSQTSHNQNSIYLPNLMDECRGFPLIQIPSPLATKYVEYIPLYTGLYGLYVGKESHF